MITTTRVVAIALGTVGLVAVTGAAMAQEADEQARRAAFEEYRACMAEHGVELPERPAGKPGPGEERMEGTEPPEIDREAAEAAFEACRDLVPLPPDVSQEELDAHRAAFEQYAACMAEQGVEVAPLIPGLGPTGGDELSDEQRAAAETAFEQCAAALPPPPPGLTAEEFETHRAAIDEFRQCLSDQGVETPGPGIPGVTGRPQKAEPSDEEREQFEAAADACAELRPEPLVGAPGPKGPEAPADS